MDTSTQFNTRRLTFNIRVGAAICASASMLCSFVAFYWFARMQKRFRHRLIMLLIYGDLTRSMSLFLYAVISLARGTVKTRSGLCQSSGFFLQYGTETSDYSVLVIALHNALQVFRPASQLSSDGLYPYRHFVYVGAITIPGIMAALAFVNPHWGYMSQGAFCSLPLRPFWYRLALAWIPRYIIAIIILGLAVAIYMHVGWEFHLLSTMGLDKGSRSDPSVAHSTTEQEEVACVATHLAEQSTNSQRRESSVISVIGSSRRESALLPSPRASRDETTRPSIQSTVTTHPAILTHPRQTSTAPNTLESSQVPSLDPSYHDVDDPHALPLSRCPTAQANQHLARQRARIHRQLRLMFIYPVVYIAMWLLPFINHCMTYRDGFAARPLYALSLLSTLSFALMGVADCVVFSLRERPWRHMPDSDGSFLGSFAKANGAVGGALTAANPDTPWVEQGVGWSGGLARLRSVRTSGSSDVAVGLAVAARTRLEMEKEERRAGRGVGEGRRKSVMLDTIEIPEDEAAEMDLVAGDEEDANGMSGGGASGLDGSSAEKDTV